MLLAALAGAKVASADETPLAEALFQRGIAAMEQGDIAAACPLLAESQRLDPGGGTLLNLALCYEREGRLATAWARYREALALAHRDGRLDRAAFAESHLRAIEPRVPQLSVVLRAPAPGARLLVDGVDAGSLVLGSPVPVDPGERSVTVSAPGRRPFSAKVRLEPGESKVVEVPALTVAVGVEPGAEKAPARSGVRRTLGYAGLGVGGAGLLTAAVLGALAIGAESTADSACPGAGACSDPRGLDASARARSLSTGATISVIGGGALVLGGVLLLVTGD